jgi:hypothetical protein
MTRVRSLEGREAGILAGIIQGLLRLVLGRPLNPIKEATGLSERGRIALEYADRVSATPVGVPDEFFAKLGRLFSEREIVELYGAYRSREFQRQVEQAAAV